MAERDLLYRAKFQDDVTSAHDEMIARATASAGRMGAAERAWNTEIQQVRKSILEQRDALVLRKEALEDPATQRAIKEARQLQEEIKSLTNAEIKNGEAVGITVRQRRELIVAMREIGRGNMTQLGGTAMVLEEGEGGISAALKNATAMLGGPYVVAAGLAVGATAAVGAAFWRASEAEAEMVHKSELLGQTLGVSSESIRGFQYLILGTNVTTEEMGRVFGIFEKNLGNNSEKFRELGITARDPLQAFEQVMDRARGMSDAIERANFLNETLGRGWEKTAPVIMKGGAALADAIEAMKIPEDVLRNFDRANSAQIEIDKNWKLITVHAGEAMSGVRAFWKEWQAGAADAWAHRGFLAVLEPFTAVGRAIRAQEKDRYVNPTEGLYGSGQSAVLTESQQAALKSARKELAKKSLSEAIDDVKLEWKERIDQFQIGSENYKRVLAAELQAEQNVRESFAKKNRGPKGPSESQIQANVVRNFDGSVTLRSGIEYDEGVDPEHIRNREKAEAKRVQREQQEINDRQKLEANAHKIKMDWVGAEAAQKKRAHEEEMRQLQERVEAVRGFGAAELSQALQGKLTIRGLEADLTAFLAEQFAQRTTKWIAEEFIKSAAASSIQVGQTAASVAQAATVSAAWATPSLEISMATFGSSAAAGSAAWFNALAAGQAVGGLPMRARGGFAFGDGIFGENGPERATPLVPVQITNNTYTTHSSAGGPRTIHIHGADIKTIKRILRNADIDGEDTSR